MKIDFEWKLVEKELPQNVDDRFYMCISENHEDDLPSFFQYEENLGFGEWFNYYDEHTLGFLDSEFRTVDKMRLDKVIAWAEIPQFNRDLV